MTEPAQTVRISSPAGLLTAVPPLLGFEPGSETLVAAGTEQGTNRVLLTLRYDLHDSVRLAPRLADHAAAAFSDGGISRAVAVGYGPEGLITPFAEALRERLPQAGVTLAEMLRAENGRYWSYVCTNPECCPPEGKPFDATPMAPAFAQTPVLASRAALAATVAPVSGKDAESMRNAIGRAVSRSARLAATAAGHRDRHALINAGLPAVSDALSTYRAGGQFASHDEAAWLAVVLRNLRIRDDAWSRMVPEHREAHQRLWTGLTRLTTGEYVAAPASLLAFTAWQSGNGALANVALDRALAADPRYSMAVLLRDVINSGAAPSLARPPMTPEQVAASYQQAAHQGRGTPAGTVSPRARPPRWSAAQQVPRRTRGR